MSGFATFTPIEQTLKEDALKYYAENNIDHPANAFFTDYFGALPTETDETKIEDKFYAGKKGSHKITKKPIKKPLAKVPPKPTVPKVDLNNPTIEKTVPTNEDWPYKDNTISNIIDISRSSGDKKAFLEALHKTNYSNLDKAFATKLAEKESTFNPDVTNKLGYYGLFQFGKSALDWLGIKKADIKNDRTKQVHAVMKLTNLNDSVLKDVREKYEGTTFKGVPITKNGIRAAAHLLGAETVKDWFNGTKKTTLAKKGFKDANGTHITEYLKEFSF